MFKERIKSHHELGKKINNYIERKEINEESFLKF